MTFNFLSLLRGTEKSFRYSSILWKKLLNLEYFSYLAPPVCAIYVQAILFKRINEPGAFWGLMVGLFVGMVRFIWQFSYEEPPCIRSHLDKRPAIISKVHYLHFGIILFIITCISSWTISLCMKFFNHFLIKLSFYLKYL